MTAVQRPPDAPRAPGRAKAPSAAADAGRGTGRRAARTTPARYRMWSIAVAGLIALATLAATASASQMRSSTRRARANSGPVLVAAQQLVSSIAEADAAATAAFLSGRDEDPEQRRLYEQALARSSEQIEDIASLAGVDA